jgi:hypothetical protein
MQRLAGAVAVSAGLVCLAAQPPPAAGPSVVRPALHEREDGPSIPSGYEYYPGQLMHFSFRIGRYTVREARVDLRWQLFATDPDGVLLFAPLSGAVSDEVSGHDKDWLPRVAETIPLPPQLPEGVYRLRIRVADELAKTSAEQAVEFRVRGRKAEKLDAIVVRGLQFFRRENDMNPLPAAHYQPGESVFGRFEIAGFSLGDKNRFEVGYGLKVLRPSGAVLYEEPEAAAESESPYYPKRYMNGGFSLNLSPDLTPGEYTVVITARDRIARSSAELSGRFHVGKK